jgi:hypothetical protein
MKRTLTVGTGAALALVGGTLALTDHEHVAAQDGVRVNSTDKASASARVGGQDASADGTFTSHGISAADTGPVVSNARRKMPILRDYLARKAPVRRAGKYARTTWYFGRGRRKRLTLCIIERSASTSVACSRVPRHYRGGWWFYEPTAHHRQLSTLIVPDGYNRVAVREGRPKKISSISNNLLWVVHRGHVVLVFRGRGLEPRRQALFYEIPRG